MPVTPSLTYVFSIHARIAAPQNAGPGLAGHRLHIPITGGEVLGPLLQGEILAGGSDWALVRQDGATAVHASYSIKTTDGTLIWVQNDGLRVSSAEVLSRLRAGESVSPDEYTFRCAPRFDVPDGPHQWLRESLFVGTVTPEKGVVVIDIWRLD